MKSLERRFNNIQNRNPYWSTYTCFAEAVIGANFTKRTLRYWFSRLVDKSEYDKKERQSTIDHLLDLNKPPEEDTNRE